MATYVLLNNTRQGTVQRWAGTIVDSVAEDKAALEACGGVLKATGTAAIDAAALQARNVRAKGGNLEEAAAMLNAAIAGIVTA